MKPPQQKNPEVVRPGTRHGYDIWADSYDQAANALVALDRRHAPRHLQPRPSERILDAGCGTGGHFEALKEAGARPIGLDFSHGMLRVARRSGADVPLVAADLSLPLPLPDRTFDAVLCSLVSEHLFVLEVFFAEVFAVLSSRGRLVFSAFHPEMAAAGVEANFERDGVQYRLGAESHTVADYLDGARSAGFRNLSHREYGVDDRLLAEIPSATRYRDRPMLLILDAVK